MPVPQAQWQGSQATGTLHANPAQISGFKLRRPGVSAYATGLSDRARAMSDAEGGGWLVTFPDWGTMP